MKNRTVGLTLLLGALAGVAGAHAQTTTLITQSTPAPTAISGVEQGNTTTRLEAPPNYILYEIEFGENGDVPCHVKATYYSMTIRPRVTVGTTSSSTRRGSEPELVRDTESVSNEFSQCDGRVRDLETVTIPNWGGNGPFTGVGSIAVCQRGNNDRLKGVTLLGATVGSSSVAQDSSNSDSENRVRCNQPQTPVACGSNRVATGVLVSHQVGGRATANGRRKITGLGLLCSRAIAQVER